MRIQVQNQALTNPMSAVAGKPSEARAAEAQQALSHAFKAPRPHGTADVHATDRIASTSVVDLGEKGWGVLVHMQPAHAQLTSQAIREAREILSGLGFADVVVLSDGTRSPIVAHSGNGPQ